MKKIMTVIILIFFVSVLFAQEVTRLTAPDNSEVLIIRDEYGVPHINAPSEYSLFYAQGYAAAEDRLTQMYINLFAATGRTSEVLGEEFLEFDLGIRNKYYTPEERSTMYDALDTEIRTALDAYAAGVNDYIQLVNEHPSELMPQEIALFKAFGFELEAWRPEASIAIIQFYVRNFGAWGGEELDRLAELQAMGWEQFNEDRPINDPTAPTTIPPELSRRAINNNSTGYRHYTLDMGAIEEVIRKRERFDTLRARLGIPDHFGSFAAVISPEKSANGNAMLLGCPQMGEPKLDSTNVVHEVELKSPTFHTGGMAIAGIPFVIIGRTHSFAWTLTSGATDNQDVYIDSTKDNSFSHYYYNGEWRAFEIYETTMIVDDEEQTYEMYRTVHGPVFGVDSTTNSVFSMKMAFWKQELDMLRSWYDMAKSESLADFEATLRNIPVSFNVMYADTDGVIKYWHVGYYNDRRDGVDPRLPHKGDGSEEWVGVIPFEELPQAVNPSQHFLVNWNNKPVIWWNNGDNVPYGSNHPYSDYITNRVLLMDDYVRPIPSFSFQNLKDIPYAIEDHGTYQQAVLLDPDGVRSENIVPPGQSGFVKIDGTPSPHKTDQWQLHLDWEFKPQIFNDPVYLPVELESFSAEVDDGEVVLRWVTATEINNRGFALEKSSDGVAFKRVAFIDGKGTTQKKTAYVYRDSFNPGELLYRLKQVDFDGSFAYSDVVSIRNSRPGAFELYQNYPNPFNPTTSITFGLPEKGYTEAKVYNAQGELVEVLMKKELEEGFHEVTFDGSAYSSGIYYISLVYQGIAVAKKMVLMK